MCLKSEEKYSESLNRDIESLLYIEPNTNFIRKDKIRQELKELENMNVDGEVFTTAVNFAKKELQKLLEE